MSDTFDSIIIGGGPAGLTAALYLARFHRKFLLFDAGESRAAWIPLTRNYPGIADGISGDALLENLRDQALRYDAQLRQGTVDSLHRRDDGVFTLTAEGETFTARTVILATGVAERAPVAIPDLRSAARKAQVRICPICDGFECTGRAIAVISEGDSGAGEALFLRRCSNHVALLWQSQPPTKACAEKLIAAHVTIAQSPLAAIRLNEDAAHDIVLQDGTRLTFDVIYSALGVDARNDLAVQAGTRLDEFGRIVADLHQNTSVEGLFAAGDLVRGLNQLTVATSEGAIAATAAHNLLRHREGLTLA